MVSQRNAVTVSTAAKYLCTFTCMNSLKFFLYSVVFWFGDLNFRIDDLDMQVVKSAIDNNKFSMLWEKDQVKTMVVLCIYIYKDCENKIISSACGFMESCRNNKSLASAVCSKILTLGQTACEDFFHQTSG